MAYFCIKNNIFYRFAIPFQFLFHSMAFYWTRFLVCFRSFFSHFRLAHFIHSLGAGSTKGFFFFLKRCFIWPLTFISSCALGVCCMSHSKWSMCGMHMRYMLLYLHCENFKEKRLNSTQKSGECVCSFHLVLGLPAACCIAFCTFGTFGILEFREIPNACERMRCQPLYAMHLYHIYIYICKSAKSTKNGIEMKTVERSAT